MELRTSGLLAGAGILVLCVVGGYGEVMRQRVLESLGMDLYNATAIAGEDLGGGDVAGELLTVCYCFITIGVVDIAVAFCLYSWLQTSNQSLALFAAGLRVVYTILELGATSSLIVALMCLHRNDAAGVRSAMLQFEIGWNAVALGVFGLHLAFLSLGVTTIACSPGNDCAQAGAMRMYYRVGDGVWASKGVYLLAFLLMVAGAGYIADSWGLVHHLPLRSPVQLSASGTAVGEVVLMLWLLVKYARADALDTPLDRKELCATRDSSS
eukprot:COSAG02_NODE_35_length_49339_cov_20.375102_9_plen_268_part_00